MTTGTRLSFAILLVGAVGRQAFAQKTVWPPTGPLFRYNGDTIWIERDSTSTRVVYRGDTVTRLVTINGVVTSTVAHVVEGDAARVIDSRDANGTPRSSEIGRKVPRSMATTDRDMLLGAIRSAALQGQQGALRAQMAQRGYGRPSNEPQFAPPQPVTYAISHSVSIMQHLDTAFYVRGCIGRGKLDTTVFVFRGDTAVDRIAPARTFGQGMVVTLVSAMFNANVRQSLSSRGPLPRSDVPSGPNQCAGTPRPLVGEQAVYSVGTIRRFHNDTIWTERDSSVARTIVRGDTVERSYFVNDNLRYSTVHVLDGDSAQLVAYVNGDGADRAEYLAKSVPAVTLFSDRRMIETELSMAELRANAVPLPSSPAQPVTYDPTPTVRLVQLGDTVRYIRGCPARERTDTTIFVLFGADSVRRLSPARMFGRAMVASLLGQMQMTSVRQNIAARDAQLAQGLPRAPDLMQPCAR